MGLTKRKKTCTAPKQTRASQAGMRPIEGSRREEIGTSECDVHERGLVEVDAESTNACSSERGKRKEKGGALKLGQRRESFDEDRRGVERTTRRALRLAAHRMNGRPRPSGVVCSCFIPCLGRRREQQG